MILVTKSLRKRCLSISIMFYNGSNIFTDDNKELITDIEHIVGSYTADNTSNTATVNLTAPKYYFYTTNA